MITKSITAQIRTLQRRLGYPRARVKFAEDRHKARYHINYHTALARIKKQIGAEVDEEAQREFDYFIGWLGDDTQDCWDRDQDILEAWYGRKRSRKWPKYWGRSYKEMFHDIYDDEFSARAFGILSKEPPDSSVSDS